MHVAQFALTSNSRNIVAHILIELIRVTALPSIVNATISQNYIYYPKITNTNIELRTK